MVFYLFFIQTKKYEPNAPSPKAFFENFFFFFFLKICSLSKKSEEDEDDDGVKVMKIIYS